jgi:hypothetical protein
MKTQGSAWSLDVLRHPSVTAHLGDQTAVEALCLALRNGRMHIPSESADHVVTLIGRQRAIDCTCLPSYRTRCGPGNSVPDVHEGRAPGGGVGAVGKWPAVATGEESGVGGPVIHSSYTTTWGTTLPSPFVKKVIHLAKYI